MSVIKKAKNLIERIREKRIAGRGTKREEKKLMHFAKKAGGSKLRKTFCRQNPPGSGLQRKLRRKAQGFGHKCYW